MTVVANPPPRSPDTDVRRRGDVVFNRLALTGALLVIAFLAGVGIFLVAQGLPALGAEGSTAWGEAGDGIWDLVGPLLWGTVLASIVALAIVAPLSVGLGLVISHYAPRVLARPVGFLVDLLAAVPSVVFGLWGVTVLAGYLQPLHEWLVTHLGWIPLFDGPASITGKTILTAGVVLALMALPIVTALMREIFAQTPRAHEEAALALGATRWEMIRLTVLPHARSGMVAALLLGLGRALGETMAVAMVLSTTGVIVTADIVSSQNSNTIAAFIANSFKEASGERVNVLIFCGLALFVLTFGINLLGRWIAARSVTRAGSR